jgi:membrane-bound lytic murein transglycosylase A
VVGAVAGEECIESPVGKEKAARISCENILAALYGSLKKSARYKYPIYKTPKNLIITDRLNSNGSKRGKIVKNKIVPYDTREQIEKNPKNKNLEPIAYVDDKFDLFFLHIQGSGKIKLDTGEIINVGYAEQNGWPYLSIGSYLIEKNYITKDEMSVQAMKDFFKANPKIMDEVFNSNPSYIFFRVSPNGATGALNTVLTAKRNLAVDRSYIPLGMPVFLSTKNPVTKEPLNQLMVAADVGGAIKGEIRADFFFHSSCVVKSIISKSPEKICSNLTFNSSTNICCHH